MSHLDQISKHLSLKAAQVEAAVKLLDEGNTIPFIARYRKEMTGSLDEEQLRRLLDRFRPAGRSGDVYARLVGPAVEAGS